MCSAMGCVHDRHWRRLQAVALGCLTAVLAVTAWSDVGTNAQDGSRTTDTSADGVIVNGAGDWAANDMGLMFIHIPKNAGTTIENTGWKYGIRWGHYMVPPPQRSGVDLIFKGPRTWSLQAIQKQIARGQAYWQDYDSDFPELAGRGAFYLKLKQYDGNNIRFDHIPPYLLPRDLNPYVHTQNFCVVRHPYDRWVSEYNYINTRPWGPPYKKGFQKCSKSGLNFFVRTAIRDVLERGYSSDGHYIPQSDYIWTPGPEGRQWCHYILRMSSLDTDFRELLRQKHLPSSVSLPANVGAKACPGLSTRDLTQSTKDFIYNVYTKDFVNLNFSRSE